MPDDATPSTPLKKIFVISPIGRTDDTGFDFTRLVLDEIVKPAARLAGGYSTPVRGDEVAAPGSITSRVVADIVASDVCVADLTGRNPNVMYEVAIAHAADKQVILLQQEVGGPPFDFTTERVIHYSTRADEANRARDDLANHLRNAFQDERDPVLAKTMNPVRVIFRDLKTRVEATSPESAILDRLDQLASEIKAMSAVDIKNYSSFAADRYSDGVVDLISLLGQAALAIDERDTFLAHATADRLSDLASSRALPSTTRTRLSVLADALGSTQWDTVATILRDLTTEEQAHSKTVG